jgi:hypothetical protein
VLRAINTLLYSVSIGKAVSFSPDHYKLHQTAEKLNLTLWLVRLTHAASGVAWEMKSHDSMSLRMLLRSCPCVLIF